MGEDEKAKAAPAASMATAPPAADSDDSTSLFPDEGPLSREQLEQIKARTMYEMVEELPNTSGVGSRKLLFLTNPQANLIASSTSSLQKMLDALEVPKPSLVISLLRSGGFREHTTAFSKQLLRSACGEFVWGAGMVHDSPPFASFEEEQEAEQQLDMYMADVILPLAAQTNAIVLCDAMTSECALTRSFTRMFALQRAKWGNNIPFTVLSTAERVKNLYTNPKKLGTAHWHEVRRASKTWRQRDTTLQRVFVPEAGSIPFDLDWFKFRDHDVDPNASILILVDSITTTQSSKDNTPKETYDTTAYSNLMTELVRYLSSNLPSLAIKTGFSNKDPLTSSLSACLKYAIDVANSGTPVLFLDVRKRPYIADSHLDAACEKMIAEFFAAAKEESAVVRGAAAARGDGDGTPIPSGDAGAGVGIRSSAAGEAAAAAVPAGAPATTTPGSGSFVLSRFALSEETTAPLGVYWVQLGSKASHRVDLTHERLGKLLESKCVCGRAALTNAELMSLGLHENEQLSWKSAVRVSRRDDDDDERQVAWFVPTPIPIDDRAALIEHAKSLYTAHCDRLASKGLCETLECCTIAYFHDVLWSDGNMLTTGMASSHGEPPRNSMKQNAKELEPLHAAIRQRREDKGTSDGGGNKPTARQIAHVAQWVTSQYFDRAFNIIEDDLSELQKGAHCGRVWAKLAEKDLGDDGKPKKGVPFTAGVEALAAKLTEGKLSLSQTELEELLPTSKSLTFDDVVQGSGRIWFRPQQYKVPLKEKWKGDSGPQTMYNTGGQVFAMRTCTRQLLGSPNLYNLNLADTDGARRLVGQLVRLDRLPANNNLEGLQLLRHAWRDYDVAVLLAGRYKRTCKFLFLLQLFIGLMVVTGSVGSSYLRDLANPYGSWSGSSGTGASSDAAAASPPPALVDATDPLVRQALLEPSGMLVEVVFGLSALGTLIISIEGLLHAKSRWRQLRGACGSLESIIWCYRARVGDYELDETRRDSSRSEGVLYGSLRHWRDELVAAASLATSNLEKRYPPSTYQHCQDAGELDAKKPSNTRRFLDFFGFRKLSAAARRAVVSPNGMPKDDLNLKPDDEVLDDYHSPVQPNRYIFLRIGPQLRFYKRRIPQYTRLNAFIKTIILLSGVAATLLARWQQLHVVTVVTAFGAALTSWTEFADNDRKIERYTRAVRGLKNLLAWWDSLGEVEKASKESIRTLVLTAEAIISEERHGWFSTMQMKPGANSNRGGGGDGNGDDGGESNGREGGSMSSYGSLTSGTRAQKY